MSSSSSPSKGPSLYPLPPLRTVASHLRDGATTARSLAEIALSADHLGAYRETHADQTLAQADAADAAFGAGEDHGPLQGLPVSVKDLFGVPGYATFAGSVRPLPPRFEQPGPVIQAALRQGATITGKTHTVEFAFGGIGTNPHHPVPINPWDTQALRAPGGSSSGAGVSLCEGSALLALGTDTAGSVRIPAAWTGNVGLKTTRGRWSTAGVVPLSTTLDTVGLLARTVDDVAFGFAALDDHTDQASGTTPRLGDLKLGRCDTLFFEECSPGVVEAVDAALAEVTRAGATLTSLHLPEVRAAHALFLQGGPVAPEAGRFLTRELPDWLEDMDPNVRLRIGDAARLPEETYQARLADLRDLAASMDQRLQTVDLLVAPTVANTPPRLADLSAPAPPNAPNTPNAYPRQNLLCLRNTCIANYLDLCALTLPIGLDAASMPVGLMLMARRGQDTQLLSAALSLEHHLGTAPQRLGLPPKK